MTDFNNTKDNIVDRIFIGRIPVKKASSFLYYSHIGIVKNLIHNLKYKRQEQIGEFIGKWYGETLKHDPSFKDIDIVIPVPLHAKKLNKRGYNQVAKFGKCIAKSLNATYHDNLIVKTENRKTQTTKSRFNRWKDSTDLYELKNDSILRDKNVLLVDDVITTGATIEACATAILKSKDVTLFVASMAVVPQIGS